MQSLTEMHRTQVAKLDEDIPLQPNIKNVWIYNFEEELNKISELLEEFPFVAMVSYLPLFWRSFLRRVVISDSPAVGHGVPWRYY